MIDNRDYDGFQTNVKQIILAVDDKPALLASVSAMLPERFTVMTVTSGLAALKVMEKHSPSLFLLDIEMPSIDGFYLASLIRKDKRFDGTPIIFLTAKNTKSDVIASIKYGGNDYIVKPVEREVLLGKVRKYLG